MKVSFFLLCLLLGNNPSGGMPLTTSTEISRLYRLSPVGLSIIYVYFPNPWNNIRPAGVYAYVRTDMRQERGRRSAWWQRERERERERGGGKRSEGIVERQRRTTVVTQKLGVTVAVRLLAPWSLPTRLTLFTRVRFSSTDFHAEATITKPFTSLFSSPHIERVELYPRCMDIQGIGSANKYPYVLMLDKHRNHAYQHAALNECILANFDAYVIQQLLHRDPKAISSITWYTMTILATGKSNFSTS
ncbi:hypothetical protein ALC60_08332 [Trachymyrmex zeteki]|uniref:Uncharacterized protein n=1 Tax=Mycetomoellerius zeteki TaxID=64791 RepID=A0A151WX41_9HYME|nr:hypothetical protein ALC60_08332 [Trachymyrmex zeteki]